MSAITTVPPISCKSGKAPLAEAVDATDKQTIVIYENGNVPSLAANRNLDIDIDVLTTHAFLELAERRHLVASAADLWARILQAAPTANPRIAGFTQRRRPRRWRKRHEQGCSR